MRRFVLLLAITTAVALGGCVLFGGFDELSGGTSTDAATSDGAVDIDVVDDSPQIPGDSGSDVFVDSAANDAGFCASVPAGSIYCDDFDEGDGGVGDLGAHIANGSFVLDTSNALSAPRCVHASRLAIAADASSATETSGHAQIATTATPTIVRAEFDVLVSTIPPANTPALSLFTIAVSGCGTVELVATAAGIRVLETSTAGSTSGMQISHTTVPLNLATSGSWNHVALVLDMSKAPGSFYVDVNGTTTIPATTTTYTFAPNAITLKYGVDLALGPVDPAEIHMDNVVVFPSAK